MRGKLQSRLLSDKKYLPCFHFVKVFFGSCLFISVSVLQISKESRIVLGQKVEQVLSRMVDNGWVCSFLINLVLQKKLDLNNGMDTSGLICRDPILVF